MQRKILISFLTFLVNQGYEINTTKTNEELIDEYFRRSIDDDQ